MPRRRWFFQVLRDMMAIGAGTEADFMYAGRINSRQLNRYLEFLLNYGLVEKDASENNSAIYRLTPRGRVALSKLQGIIDLLGVDDDVDP